MPTDFTIRFRTTELEADPLVPLSMSAEGVGAATYLLAFLAGSRAGGVAGLALVLLGASALFAHLGRPLRAWRVMTETGRTWMNRGALFTALLVVVGVPALLLRGEHPAIVVVQAVALGCTFVVLLYTGMLFSSIGAVPFWNTPLLPVVFLLHSLTSAALIVTSMRSLTDGGLVAHPRECGAVFALLASTLAFTSMLTAATSPSAAVRESIRSLTSGRLRALFRGGAVIAGLAAPLALVIVAYVLRDAGTASGALLVAAVVLRLAGDVSFRRALLRAGVHAPVI